MSADVRGIEVELCMFVAEPTPDGPASAPDSGNSVELTPRVNSDAREWRLVEPDTDASPTRRWFGLASAALGLCLAVYHATDLHAALAIRQDAQLARRMLHARVSSSYELTFPNNHEVNKSTQEMLAATTTRIRVDGFMALLGGVLLVGGLGMYKANGFPSRDDVG
jgi:hypothetical protein